MKQTSKHIGKTADKPENSSSTKHAKGNSKLKNQAHSDVNARWERAKKQQLDSPEEQATD